MAEYWQNFALDEIDRSSRRLSIWERPFIDSIRPAVKQRVPLSAKQDIKLMQIYQRLSDVTRLPR